MGASLPLSVVRQQPQQGVPLDRSNKFAANALGIISAGVDINYATGKPLVRGGSGHAKGTLAAGRSWAHRKNFWVETESLPAIGTASFVEFWVGYPDMVNTGCPLGSGEAGFVLGSSANQSGICQQVGSVRTNTTGTGTGGTNTWGCVYNWNGTYRLYSSNDTLTSGVLTVLVVVRRQSGTEMWRNGVLVNFIAGAPVSIPAQTLIVGSFIEQTNWCSSADSLLAGRVLMPIEPTAAETQAFSANPWQIFKAPSSFLAYPVLSNISGALLDPLGISGTASEVSLNTGANLNVVAASPAAGSAMLATSTNMPVAAATASSGDAVLQTWMPTATTAMTPTAGAVVLTASSSWEAGSTISTRAESSLSTACSITAAVLAKAGGIASMTTAIDLAPTSAATASGNAIFTTSPGAQPGVGIDAGTVSASHTVTFPGCGGRTVVFDGGSRAVEFEGGAHAVEFNGALNTVTF